MVHESLYSSASAEWGTPQWLFDALNAEFPFSLDPCSTHENAKCDLHYTCLEDGLLQDWADHTVFMNPPYGRVIGRWMKKAYDSAQQGATVVCLIPARTDATWWHRYATKGEIRFLRGRLRFVGGKHSAPFPSAVVVFRPLGYAVRAVDLLGRSEGIDGRLD
jgi:site-specific DNA-methyltransferase (adenine-specific)